MTPNLLDELEPCPFCGREPAVRIPTDKDGFAVHVSCRCGAQLYGRNRHFAGEQEAIAAWNRRTHATLADMAKRLEAAERDAARVKLEAERDFLHDWLQYAFYPVGMDCCGRGQGGDCCGDGVPVYATLPDVQQAMNKRLGEIEDAIAAIDATQEGEG